MFTIDEADLEDFKESDPYLYQEMTLKKSTSFKDPSKHNTGSPQKSEAAWNLINQMPTHSIDKVIRPKVLQMDAEGCQKIIEKIN